MRAALPLFRNHALALATCVATLCLFFTAIALRAGEIPLNERQSGYDIMSRDTRAMQDDDTANPATLSLLDGEALWSKKAGAANKACADCHNDAAVSMKGVAARYPAFDDKQNKPLDIEARINTCRTQHQQAAPLAFESPELLALSTYVGRQSRGMEIAPPAEKMQPAVDQGREIFEKRQGQLNLSCAQCHDDNWGRKLAGSPIPQAHPTGYPLYRLEWQSMGSLQRRLRNCLVGMRAEGYAFGAPEYVALEAFLMWRARGMKVETPAVRP
jgi:sulfur-oxidizing protein SoxA